MTQPAMPSRSLRSRLLPAVVLVALTLLAYLPVMRVANYIWDDDDYVLRNGPLRSTAGLIALWTDPHATPQYYPLVHTTFWIEYHLWALRPVGYHIDNVLIHAGNTLLLWWLLRRIGLGGWRGAFWAAAVFAVHPVNLESVAWITERKNVLSLLFYLASLHMSLRLWGLEKDQVLSLSAGTPQEAAGSGSSPREPWYGDCWWAYATAFALFVMALLSKSVTCSLPAAIAVLIWWKHGTIRRRQMLLLAPMLLVGAVSAYFTSYLERTQVGASGKPWDWNFWQRCAIAGRALCFYAGKLLCPRHLSFVYSKWDMTHGARLAVFPIGVLAVIVLLWLLRKRMSRGPVAAVLLYCGTLLPALGFINVFPMKYSFVADHFQYHASIALIALVAALASRIKPRSIVMVCGIMVLAVLFGETWRRGPICQNSRTLWEATLKLNQTSYMVWGNLGDEYDKLSANRALPEQERAAFRGKSIDCYAKCLKYGPNEGMAHVKWALVHEWQNDLPGAEAEYRLGIKLFPLYPPAYTSLARVLAAQNKPDEAIEWYRQCLALYPHYIDARCDYGELLERLNRPEDALEQYRQAVHDWPWPGERPAYDLSVLQIKQGIK